MDTIAVLTIVTLLQCQNAALQNYPRVKQSGLIEQTAEYSVDNAYRGYYPEATINAQATYQSAVTEVPVRIPQFAIEALSLDQYRAQLEVIQTIWDGNTMAAQAGTQRAKAEVSKHQLEVELYGLKDRVNQLFFGLLLVHEQIEQTRLMREDLSSALTAVQKAANVGASSKKDVYLLEAELLNVEQRLLRLRGSKTRYVRMLARLTGLAVDTATTYQYTDNPTLDSHIHRPELRLFAAQRSLLNSQTNAIDSRYLPKLQAFVNVGYGRPGLDMLMNEFSPYYVTGVRMKWSITDLWASAPERNLLTVNQAEVDVQHETFLFNTDLSLTQFQADFDMYTKLLDTDAGLLEKLTAVRDISQEQLTHGTITSHDYLRDVHALDIARREHTLHQIQRELAAESYRITTGN